MWSDDCTETQMFGHNDRLYLEENFETSKSVNFLPTIKYDIMLCRRDWCNIQKRLHHEEKTLCRNIKTISQDIKHTTQHRHKGVCPMDNYPKVCNQISYKVA